MRALVAVALCAVLVACSGTNTSNLGENSLACIRAEGASLFTVFSGYVETRIVHIPARLQEAMDLDDLMTFTESCWIEGSAAVMLQMLRAQEADTDD